MRTIQQNNQYKRDLKRSQGSGRHPASELAEVLKLLADDTPLPEKYRDHALTQNWHGFRECHVKPDLLLVYRLSNAETLELHRFGSHSELCL
jgi:mRNA interferase YafQ